MGTDLRYEQHRPSVLLGALDERVGLLRSKRDEIGEELRLLRSSRPALARAARLETRKRPVRRGASPVRTAERQAGPGNVAKVADALRRLGGRATQAVLTERTGLNSGTMTYALRALTERGVARPTGESVRRSAEFALTGEREYVMPPGSGQS